MRALTGRDPAAFTRLTKARLNFTLSTTRRNGKFYWAIEKNVADFGTPPTVPTVRQPYVRTGQIPREIFVDAISAIHVTGPLVRIDLMKIQADRKNADGQPAVEIHQRLIMPLDGFIRSLAAQQDMAEQLVKAGLVRKNNGLVPESSLR